MIKSRISIIKQGTGAFLAVWMAAACSLPLHGQEGEIDFAREIEPLLKKHCIACHGLDAQNAGLRLDSAEQAAIGGVSGKPILGGTRETNELFSRIHSDDPTYRMPKNGPPLTSDEIERIGRWVDQGTPWPEPVSPVIVRAPPSAWDKLMDLIEGRRSNEWTRLASHARKFLYPLVLVHLLLLFMERGKKMRAANDPRTRGRWRRWFDLCSALRVSHYVLGMTLVAAFVVWQANREQLQETQTMLQDALARAFGAERQLGLVNNPAEVVLRGYGDPPVPIRPPLPPRLGGEFYRGNCERNKELFNNGHYRTATFRVALCNSQHQDLQVGDDVPADGLWVKVEIIRAPHTADALFTEEYLNSVYLSQSVHRGDQFRPLTDEPARLETIEPQQHWAAYYPLGSPSAEAKEMSGLIYLYWGLIRGQAARGTLHYGIPYKLLLDDGKIAAGSDLWIGSLFWSTALANPQRDRVPLDEWFDYRPIPEIVGGNTTDPELLGLPEHERKLRQKRQQEESGQD